MIEKKQILRELWEIPRDASIAIYGCGQGGRLFKKVLQKKRKDVKVLYFLDSFKKGERDGLRIVDPGTLIDQDLSFDLICIASDKWYEIKSNLQRLGIDEFKVVSPFLLDIKGRKKQPGNADLAILIQDDYCELYEFCRENNFPGNVVTRFKEFRDGTWRNHYGSIASSSFSFAGKTVVDYGCKFGQSTPIFLRLGAAEVIGIDVKPGYIKNARKIMEAKYPRKAEFFETGGALVPLQPETVDFVLMNEVISHINPQYLEMVFFEISRILKKGGRLFISDCNNIGNPRRAGELLDLWEHYEHGPDGFEGTAYRVKKSFETQRKEIIAERYPGIPEEELDFLAANTSGLSGDILLKEAELYIKKGEFIRRPYRRGMCPTSPGEGGVMIERGFHPLEVEFLLQKYGFKTQRTYRATMHRKVLHFVKDIVKPGWRDMAARGIKITGVKEF